MRSNYLLVPILFLFASCADEKKTAPVETAIPVTITTVEAAPAEYYDEYPATVVALNQTELRAQVTGYVTGIFFKDGDKVRKGQKLYTIDQQLYSANYQQALANLQVQETNLLKAQKDAERYHELDRQDAIAKQQVDYADAALEAAKKQVAAAKANLNAVGANVNFATITAPFSGTIGISQVRTGTSVVAGQTILNTVSTDDPMAVDLAIDQNEIYRFSTLQSSGAKDSSVTIAFGSEVYPFPGKISLIDRAVDPQTGTIKTRIVFPNDKKLLRAGMTTTVRVKSNQTGNQILIPYKAVTEQLGSFYVYVLGDSSRVNQRKVELGRQLAGDIIINKGLSEGEKIVVEGIQNLREGALVQTGSPAAAAPKK